jgi:hypothetical protein
VPPAEVLPEEPILEVLLGVERDLGRPGRLVIQELSRVIQDFVRDTL